MWVKKKIGSKKEKNKHNFSSYKFNKYHLSWAIPYNTKKQKVKKKKG